MLSAPLPEPVRGVISWLILINLYCYISYFPINSNFYLTELKTYKTKKSIRPIEGHELTRRKNANKEHVLYPIYDENGKFVKYVKTLKGFVPLG